MKETRKRPVCPVEHKCGGCSMLHLPYPKQLQKKHQAVQEVMAPFCPVEDVVGMNDPYHYRNKVHAAFGRGKDGRVISGIYQEGSHRIVPVDRCLIENETADAIIGSIRDLAISFKLPIYDEDRGTGFLRHVLIRVGYHSGEVMVVLVAGSHVFPSRKHFLKALLTLHPEITTVVLNINGAKTSMILGQREQVLYGEGSIQDQLCGLTFRISAKSFYQVNAAQTERLYHKAIALADLTGTERVVDAYSGIGTIGLIAAKNAKEVISIESNAAAVRDGIANARRNGIKNVRFVCDDAARHLRQMSFAKERVDVLLMDPPRSGSTRVFLDALVRMRPKRVVYISCNPQTLARDVKYLSGNGYQAQTAVPFDMFCFCDHLEVVVSMCASGKAGVRPFL